MSRTITLLGFADEVQHDPGCDHHRNAPRDQPDDACDREQHRSRARSGCVGAKAMRCYPRPDGVNEPTVPAARRRSAFGRVPRSIMVRMPRDLPTAPLAAAGMLAGYGVAVASGFRPLGGLVLAGFGVACMSIWIRRDGVRTTVVLTGIGLAAFAASHGLALLIGAWPAVGVAAAAAGAASWKLSDSRRLELTSGSRAAARTSS